MVSAGTCRFVVGDRVQHLGFGSYYGEVVGVTDGAETSPTIKVKWDGTGLCGWVRVADIAHTDDSPTPVQCETRKLAAATALLQDVLFFIDTWDTGSIRMLGEDIRSFVKQENNI